MQRGPSALGGGGLPVINTASVRGVSPNVAKRAAWSTPRDRQVTPETKQQQLLSPAALEADGAQLLRQGPATQATSTPLVPLEDALEVLHAVLEESDDQSDSARRRGAALQETRRLHEAEEYEIERTRLAGDDQLQTTLELLQTELARERRRRSSGESARPALAATAPAADRKSPSKRQVSRLAPRLRNSPFKPRSKGSGPAELEERESAEEGIRLALFERDTNVESVHASAREVKLHELRGERSRWQRDYETMREQVIEEKARQVALFQRLELVRRSHASQLNEAEAALGASQADVERLQARLAQGRISAAHEARRTEALLQTSRSERQRLVCALAETRHKFREWKEGEAATLRATREQAVHALRTEYELKLARHQEEKQKLRDKVKDLEVSLRLLQRDRHMSPGELSERKGTMLQINVGGTGDVGAADFIEAQGRIHELEGLLQLSKERQDRQDALLRVSETALARLSQERELDALENLSLPSPAVALAMTNLTSEIQPEGDKPIVRDVPTPSPVDPPSTGVMSRKASQRLERDGSSATISGSPSTPNRSLERRQSIGGGGIGTNLEKEMLRRKSVALTAEVNRYQKIVVQSMEEVRALKESRRRNRSGSISSSTTVLSPREAYLLEELAASRREVEAMKTTLKKKRKKGKVEGEVKADILGLSEAGDADSSSSSSSDSDSNSVRGSDGDSDEGEDGGSTGKVTMPIAKSVSQPRLSLVKELGHDDEDIDEKEVLGTDAAVKAIQTCSKGFLARREFIRKKLAIGKIKARYRGYLVRKNYESLGGSLLAPDRKLLPSGLAPQAAPDFLLVTEAMQYKMQIVEPHHEVSYVCEGGTNNRDKVEVVMRVSKDPPILQLQVIPSNLADQMAAVPRVVYFHLFETIALLPFEDEEMVLETSSEKDIARIFSLRLIVQRKGSDSDYHFFIARPGIELQDGIVGGKEDPTARRSSRTLLTELPVQSMESRAASASSDTFDASLDGGATPSVFGQEVDLDLLIREARTDPLDSEPTKPRSASGSDAVPEAPTSRIRRLVRRLSSNSFDIEEQQP
ncbi:hypothetical protein KRP22_012080 [Phytophthora ramorum]|uniref:uncharacterized protein n=1 Tax=Phytophthora ramorum TaxID=164328 RepID=UPI0030AF85F0|nr:hypothetical protein KRP23_10841 [Phytophthora ramorum]KAH7498778.1 hypothetical protein KRP22_11918 [Phytophthora ramorum]